MHHSKASCRWNPAIHEARTKVTKANNAKLCDRQCFFPPPRITVNDQYCEFSLEIILWVCGASNFVDCIVICLIPLGIFDTGCINKSYRNITGMGAFGSKDTNFDSQFPTFLSFFHATF